MNYWIFSVTNHREDNTRYLAREIYEQRMNDGFWGIGERTINRNNLKEGDKIIFYIGKPEMNFAGSAEVKRGYYKQSSKQKIELSHGTGYYSSDYGIDIDKIEIWDKSKPINNFINNLSFIKNKSHWWAHLQGGITRISKEDFELITGKSNNINKNDSGKIRFDFEITEEYSRKDIFSMIGISNPGGGNWFTGYHHIEDNWFIFCNIGTPGRTGHDYNNRFDGDELIWYGKTGSHIGQPSIKQLTSHNSKVYVFYREDNKDDFTFAGLAKAKEIKDTKPVEIHWSFRDYIEKHPEMYPNELTDEENKKVLEGSKKQITVNAYERNPAARKRCIEHWGFSCAVCGFDFEKIYGEVGKGFIHVHHLIPISEIGEEYEINPITDMRPVCPNCHAMLHRENPPLTIENLRSIIKKSDL